MPKKNTNGFGDAVRTFRKARGETQTQLGIILGDVMGRGPFTAKHISGLERGTWVPKDADFIKWLAYTIGADADALLVLAGVFPPKAKPADYHRAFLLAKLIRRTKNPGRFPNPLATLAGPG